MNKWLCLSEICFIEHSVRFFQLWRRPDEIYQCILMLVTNYTTKKYIKSIDFLSIITSNTQGLFSLFIYLPKGHSIINFSSNIDIDQGSATCGPWATCGPKICFCGPLNKICVGHKTFLRYNAIYWLILPKRVLMHQSVVQFDRV